MTDIYAAASRLLRLVYRRRLTSQPVHDVEAMFPDFVHFAAHWEDVRGEFLSFVAKGPPAPLVHELMPEQRPYSANDGRAWRAVLLRVYGRDLPALRSFPAVAAALSRSPHVTSAAISILESGKLIPVHRGPFGGVLRFQLGLICPLDDSGRAATVLCLDGVEYRIGAGEYLLWDDTFDHLVENRSAETRVALLLDVLKPDMPADMRALSNLVLRLGRMYLGRNSLIRDDRIPN